MSIRDEEKVEDFLKDLAEITKKHGIEVRGDGDSPWLMDSETFERLGGGLSLDRSDGTYKLYTT